jgi:hypothetical protein
MSFRPFFWAQGRVVKALLPDCILVQVLLKYICDRWNGIEGIITAIPPREIRRCR